MMSNTIEFSAKNVRTVEDAKRIIEERALTHVKIGLFDHDGIMLGKYMHKDKFLSALDNGFAFCDVIFGWDSKDKLIDNLEYTGWHTGYPDTPARIIPESCREIMFEDNQLLFLAEMTGKAEALCPRGILRRIIKKAESMGFTPFAALEYEFFMFNETPESVQEKGFNNIKPMTPGSFGYSTLRNSVHAELYHDILRMGEVMNFPIEGLHTETGPGVLEAALIYDHAISAADKAALFKTFMKVLAQRKNMMATFMAKWSPDYSGQSGHIHLSLNHSDSNHSAFYDETQAYNMSTIQRHFLAGQQQLMPEFLALLAPNINSYRRLTPGFWAPTSATWGVENRTTALRVIPGTPKSQRIEHRLGASDTNPYLALAASLGAGLYGIEHQLEPEPMIKGNAYEQSHPEHLTLPSTLGNAAQRFRQSKIARSLFGDTFVDHYATTREWEEKEFQRHISQWELDRYFEII